jgi:arabinogalactan oligomer/maltooligosaccharide transport system substrate-binding protein
MKKNLWLIVSLFAVLMLVLAACGGGTNETTNNGGNEVANNGGNEVVEEPTEEVVVEEPTAEPTEEVVVEEPTEEVVVEEPTAEPTPADMGTGGEEFDTFITIWADDTRAPILAELAAAFQDTYQVGLVVEQVADIRDQFVIAAPAGEGPDIILGAHDWLGQLVSSGLLAPVDLGDKATAFTEVSLTGFTYEGQLYGMPYATENLAFFYNTELVPVPPTTWDELVAMGTALQESGDVTFGLALTGTTYDAFPLQTAFGGYVFGRDEAGNYNPNDIGIDSEGMIAAGQWIADNVASGFLSDNTDWDTAHVMFETGEIPFLMAGPWALDRLRTSGVPYGITNFPTGTQEGAPFAGVQGFMVNALSENVLLAQAFLTEFVATDEVMTELYLAGNRPSAFVTVLEATEDPDLAAFGAAGANAVLMPAIPEMGSVWGSWGDAFSLIIQGEQTPEEALTVAGTQIRELVAGAAAGMVNVPGSWQLASGACEGDWDPACEGSALTDNGDGTYSGTFTLPAGDYEVKVALDGGWTVNYGVDGEQDGANYAFSLTADGSVTFTYDSATNLLEIVIE